MWGPCNVDIIEDGVREHFVGGQYHLERIGLEINVVCVCVNIT